MAEVTLGAPDDYDLGRLVVRVEVAAASEGLRAPGRRPRGHRIGDALDPATC